MKFDDGAQRAAPVIVAALLASLAGHDGADLAALAGIATLRSPAAASRSASSALRSRCRGRAEALAVVASR